jgi:hypothetical protein
LEYADELSVVVVPVVGDVCTSVVLVGGGPLDGLVTVNVYDHEPTSPNALVSVPETVYVFGARIPVVLTAPVDDTLKPVLVIDVA